jgi:hypothetical protein
LHDVLRAFAVIVVVAALGAHPPAAEGIAQDQQEPAPTVSAVMTSLAEGEELPGVIPRPNQGREPRHPGDPGGWLQLTLAAIVVVAVATIFTVVARSASRTTRSKRLE